eukprot:c12816_g2_i1.p1 GENE.c12816_g2_i1~~c12816_g2_i1.p1  ORF type:complete len:361 (-),score=83.89 c12816_g2_i1:297-1379(-)
MTSVPTSWRPTNRSIPPNSQRSAIAVFQATAHNSVDSVSSSGAGADEAFEIRPNSNNDALRMTSRTMSASSRERQDPRNPLIPHSDPSSGRRSITWMLLFVGIPCFILSTALAIGIYLLVAYVECQDANEDASTWKTFTPDQVTSLILNVDTGSVVMTDQLESYTIDVSLKATSHSHSAAVKHLPVLSVSNTTVSITSSVHTNMFKCASAEVLVGVCPSTNNLEANITSSSANIRIDGNESLRMKRLAIATDSGPVHVTSSSVGLLDVITGGGSITLDMLPESSITAFSSTGTIRITVARGFDGIFELVSGGVVQASGTNLTIHTHSPHHMSGMIGNQTALHQSRIVATSNQGRIFLVSR